MARISDEALRTISAVAGVSSAVIRLFGAAGIIKTLEEIGAGKTVRDIKAQQREQNISLPKQKLRGDTDLLDPDAVNQPQHKSTIGNSSWVAEIAFFPEVGSKRGVIGITTQATGKKYVFPDRAYGDYLVLADPSLAPSPKPPKGAKSLSGTGTGVGSKLGAQGFLGGSSFRNQAPQVKRLADIFAQASTKDEMKALSLMQKKLGKFKF